MLKQKELQRAQSKTDVTEKNSPSMNSAVINPLSDLLADIGTVLKNFDNKKDIFNGIQAAVKKRTPAILSSTQNLWFKKYEQEVESKLRTEEKLNKTLEANRILSTKLNERPSLSFTATGQKSSDSSMTPVHDNQSNENTPKGAYRTRPIASFNILDNQILHNFSSSEEVKDNPDPKECPLCRQSLHEVFEELREYKLKLDCLNDTIARMNLKGQSMVSQNTFLTAENTRLERMYKDMQETVKVLESHVAKVVSEFNDTKKKYLKNIDDKRIEIEMLVERIREFENREKRAGENNDGYSCADGKSDYPQELCPEKPSSSFIKRLLEENKNLQYEVYNLHKTLMELKTAHKGSRNSNICNDPPASMCFEEDISKIAKKDDLLSAAGDDTVNHLRLLTRKESREPSQPVGTSGRTASQRSPSPNKNRISSSTENSGSPNKNLKVIGRENYASCALI